MDITLLSFQKDKKQFLIDFALRRFIINPVIIGIILSYSQKDLKSNLSLLESLERLIYDIHDDTHKSYCIGKYYKSILDYLPFLTEPNLKFCEVYSRIGMILPSTKLISS